MRISATRLAAENQFPYWLLRFRSFTGQLTEVEMGILVSRRKLFRPTPVRVAELLDYDSETGKLSWRIFEPKRGVRPGMVAGHVDASHGYRTVSLDGSVHVGAQVAWVLYYGEWPAQEVDHINRVKSDDRISNLRLASKSQQQANTGIKSNNTSGARGVYFYQQRAVKGWAPYWAYITVRGNRLSLGYFDSVEEAATAYTKAAKKYFGEFACSDSGSTQDIEGLRL